MQHDNTSKKTLEDRPAGICGEQGLFGLHEIRRTQVRLVWKASWLSGVQISAAVDKTLD